MLPLVQQALKIAGIAPADLTCIAYTKVSLRCGTWWLPPARQTQGHVRCGLALSFAGGSQLHILSSSLVQAAWSRSQRGLCKDVLSALGPAQILQQCHRSFLPSLPNNCIKKAVQAQHCWSDGTRWPMPCLQSFVRRSLAQEPTLLWCHTEAALCMSCCSASRQSPAQLWPKAVQAQPCWAHSATSAMSSLHLTVCSPRHGSLGLCCSSEAASPQLAARLAQYCTGMNSAGTAVPEW